MRMRRCKKVKGKIYKGNNGNGEWFEYKLALIIDTYEELNIELDAIKKGKIHNKQREKQSFLKKVRKKIETTFSKLKYMGIENIKAVFWKVF